MPDFTRQILKYFAQPDARPQRPKDLQKLLRVKQSQASPFRAAIEELVESGKLHRSTNGTVSIPRPKLEGTLLGTIRRTSRGVGYFTPNVEATEEPRGRGPAASLVVEE